MTVALVLDVDGTLVDMSGVMEVDLVDALREAHRNLIVVLASGRPLYGLTSVKEKLGFDCATIACNGAIAYLPETGIVSRTPFRTDVLGVLWRKLKTLAGRSAVLIYGDEQWRGYGDYHLISNEARLAGRPPVAVAESLPAKPDERIKAIYKISLLAHTANEWKVHHSALRQVGHSSWYASQSSPFYTEIVSASVTKAAGLSHLRPMFGEVTVVAVGDGENDLPLLEVADRAIAMSWAPADLRAVATQVLKSRRDLAATVRSLSQECAGVH